MRLAISLATLILIGALTVSAQNPASAPAASGATTLTGCLKGSSDQYYIVLKKGTRYSLLAKDKDLSSFANHQVTVTGKADPSRVPNTKAHQEGLFSVDSVTDQGACKK